MKGVAVGCGWQTFVAYVNVGCYYGIGIPLGSVLGFYFKFGAKVSFSISYPKPFIVCFLLDLIYCLFNFTFSL